MIFSPIIVTVHLTPIHRLPVVSTWALLWSPILTASYCPSLSLLLLPWFCWGISKVHFWILIRTYIQHLISVKAGPIACRMGCPPCHDDKLGCGFLMIMMAAMGRKVCLSDVCALTHSIFGQLACINDSHIGWRWRTPHAVTSALPSLSSDNNTNPIRLNGKYYFTRTAGNKI